MGALKKQTVRWFLIGYLILAAGTVTGLGLSWTATRQVEQERIDRAATLAIAAKANCEINNKQTYFLGVFLSEGTKRFLAVTTNPRERAELRAFSAAVKEELKTLDCAFLIPPSDT